jgi:hypothetical protein
MPADVHEQAAAAVNFNNVKVVGEGPALSTGLSQQNAVAQQQRVNELASSVLGNAMNASQQFGQLAAQQALQISANSAAIQQAMLGRVTRHILDLSGEQAAAFEKTLGAQLQDQLTELNASLAGGQIQSKVAQSTAPQTGTGGAFGSETGLSQQISLAMAGALAPIAAQLSTAISLLQARTGGT